MQDEPRVWVAKRKRKSVKKDKNGNPVARYSYRLRWVCPRTGVWQSMTAGTDIKRAEYEQRRIERELAEGTFQRVQRVQWADFVRDHIEKIVGEANRRIAKQVLDEFGDVCKPVGPHAVLFQMVEKFDKWLHDKKLSQQTINKKHRYIRHGLNMAKKRSMIKHNPMDDWVWVRADEKIPRYLSDDEKAKVIGAFPTFQWRMYADMLMLSGCRRNELLTLSWADVDFGRGVFTVRRTKGKRDKRLPLADSHVDGLRILQAETLRDGGPFVGLGHSDAVSRRFKKYVQQAGVENCTIKSLRSSFATDLARANVNQMVAQRLLGHASPSTTVKYYQHADDDMKRDAIRRLQSKSAG